MPVIKHFCAVELPSGLLKLYDEWLLARGSLNPQLLDVGVFRVCSSNIFDRGALSNLFMVELDLLSHFFEIQF